MGGRFSIGLRKRLREIAEQKEMPIGVRYPEMPSYGGVQSRMALIETHSKAWKRCVLGVAELSNG